MGDAAGAEPRTRRTRPLPPAVLRALRCPVCARGLAEEEGSLRCPAGHGFDRARQGHVHLRPGAGPSQNADSTAMVAAREELLGSGLYAPVRDRLAEAVAEVVPDVVDPLVLDLAGGTGYHLAGVLDRLPRALGVCVDLSTPALRRAARCHPRAVAVGADLRDALPLADGAVAVATSVFGPRNAAETARVLQPGGALVVVTPTLRHLAELVGALGMVGVDGAKEARLARSLPGFERVAAVDVTEQVVVGRDLARALAAMGPSAHHAGPEQLDERVARLGEATTVTVAVTVGTWTPVRGTGRIPVAPPSTRRRTEQP